jgi:cytochrome b561
MTSLIQPQRPHRYDSLSRALHWLMALGFAWIFSSALAHKFCNESALDNFLWATHKPAGLLLLIAVLLRVIWALLSRTRRPAPLSLGASLGHLALYLLMLAVPAIGMLRQYGSGRAFEAFGVQLMAATPDSSHKWMIDLGGNFHSLLGWTLLVLVLGHIALTLWHRRSPASDVLPRMLG